MPPLYNKRNIAIVTVKYTMYNKKYNKFESAFQDSLACLYLLAICRQAIVYRISKSR